MSKGRKSGNKFLNFMNYTRKTDDGCRDMRMGELQSFCGRLWEKMSEGEKNEFKFGEERRVRAAPGNYLTGEGCKYDTLGREMKVVRAMKSEKEEKEALMREFIAQEIQNVGTTENLSRLSFFVIHVNLWVKTVEGNVVPAEIAIIKMNIMEGILDHFHCLLDPLEIPGGYSSAARKFIEKFKIDFYDKETKERILRHDYEKVFHEMVQFIGSYEGPSPPSPIRKQDSLNPLYFLPPQETREKYKKSYIEKSLDWLADKAGYEEGYIPVMDLSELFYQFHSRLKPTGVESVVPSHIMGAFWLEQDRYIYQEGLKCRHHKEEFDIDNSICALSKIKIQGFIFLEFCSTFLSKSILIPGKHIPSQRSENQPTYDDDNDLKYDVDDKDEKSTTIYAESSNSEEDDDDDDDFKSIKDRSCASNLDFQQISFSSAHYKEWKKRFYLSGRSTPNSSQILKATRSRQQPTPTTPKAGCPLFKFSGMKL